MTSKNKIGVICSILSYLLWGVLPLYWKAIDKVPPFEILSHRILWAFVLVGIILIIKSQLNEIICFIKNKRNLLFISLSATMVTVNWGLYIWSVNSGHIVQASLGYYINPLISVFLGVIFLKEKLTKGQIVALIMAIMGVVVLTVQYGKLPWISLALAITFALYGLLKKLTNASSMVSLWIETAIVLPIALIYIVSKQASGTGALGNISLLETVLLVGAGLATAAPLLLFAEGAKRIPLSTLGFIQYISPTMSLLIGVLLFKETFTTLHLVGFSFIWLSLLTYSLSETNFIKSRLIEKSTA